MRLYLLRICKKSAYVQNEERIKKLQWNRVVYIPMNLQT